MPPERTGRNQGFIYAPVTVVLAGPRRRGAVSRPWMFAFGGSGSVRGATLPTEPDRLQASESVPAVLWVPDDDVRLLLRGILALQHCPVALELASAEALRRWDPPPVALLVVDAVSGADRWRQELVEALKLRPELRAVVLLPRAREGLRREAESLGARATVVRPFAIREFVAAVREALRGSPATMDG